MNYGKIQRGNFNAVVTSGIAVWGYPLRTEKHSEYVVLNIVPKSIQQYTGSIKDGNFN